MFLISSCSCLYAIYLRQVLCWEWKCSWSISVLLQLHMSDQQFYCLLMCCLYWRFNSIVFPFSFQYKVPIEVTLYPDMSTLVSLDENVFEKNSLEFWGKWKAPEPKLVINQSINQSINLCHVDTFFTWIEKYIYKPWFMSACQKIPG